MPVAGGCTADACAVMALADGRRRGCGAGCRSLRGHRRARCSTARSTTRSSIGDFVVSGGELPALMLIDAIVRQLPGALNDAESARQDSFVDGLAGLPALHAARDV